MLDARQIMRMIKSRALTVTHSSEAREHGTYSSNATLSSERTAGNWVGSARVRLFRMMGIWYPLLKMAGEKVYSPCKVCHSYNREIEITSTMRIQEQKYGCL